jgi:hypothetical protein
VPDVSADVPDVWKAIGFSGLFSIESELGDNDRPMTPEQVNEFEARLPDRVPFGSNSGWLALRVNRQATPPTVVLVRRDADAVTEVALRSNDGLWHPW